MNFAENDQVISQYGPAKIVRVEREPQGHVPGRYTILTGTIQIENYPGYLLKPAQVPA